METKSPPDSVVFAKSERTVRTRHGEVVIIAPKDLTLKEFTAAFAPLFGRKAD